MIDARSSPTVTGVDGFAEINPDRQSCEDLLCAVIALAIKDLEQIEHLERKPALTTYESKKLLTLTQEWPPAAFLEGDWFEEICQMLNVEPEAIRAVVRERQDRDKGSPAHDEHRLDTAQGVAVASSDQQEETSR